MFEAGVLDARRGAVRADGAPPAGGEVTPERTAAELRARLELISEVKRTAMTKDVDYGVVPGTDKATLFKPGAEKLALVFKLDVQPRNEPIWGPRRAPDRDLPRDRVPRADRRPAGLRGGDLLKPRANPPTANRSAPARTAARPRSSRANRRYGGGLVCWKKRDGCGAQFPDATISASRARRSGEIENPDLPDTWNAVDKMSKKRGYVDAVLSVTGASAIFTQDIGADPTEAAASGLEHGPVVAGELSSRQQAAIRLCGGDLDQAKRCGRSSKASSTATCRRRPRKRCCSPPRPRPRRAAAQAPYDERSQQQRVIARAAAAGQEDDERPPGRREPQATRRPAASQPANPQAPEARRTATRTARGCGRSRPSAGSATPSWRT